MWEPPSPSLCERDIGKSDSDFAGLMLCLSLPHLQVHDLGDSPTDCAVTKFERASKMRFSETVAGNYSQYSTGWQLSYCIKNTAICHECSLRS